MTIDGGTFTCQKYHLDMPAVTADDFCARRHRKAQDGDFCLTCERGIQLAKGGQSGILKGWKREHQYQKEEMNQKGETMGGITEKKKCKDCGAEYKPTSNRQERCESCKAEHTKKQNAAYKEKHKQSHPKAGRQGTKPSAPKSGDRGNKRPSPSGGGTVPSERVLEVLVKAGFVSQEIVDRCRELIEIAG